MPITHEFRRTFFTMVALFCTIIALCFVGWRTQATAFATLTVTNTNDSGAGSLRAAITASNASVGTLDAIEFNLGAGTPTINLLSALPTITDPVTINGNTGGSTRVELNGAGAGAGASGLTITAGSATIAGLVINRFGNHGIDILTNGGNTIRNCYIGTDANGTADLGNTFDGVVIQGPPNNTIGGTTAAERNVISGNNRHGVFILTSTATGNKVTGNFIGTDANGTADLGNALEGVQINNAPNNTVGGATVGERNVISGNDRNGVVITEVTASGNKVIGNYIGTDVNGTADLGNTFDGAQILIAPNNTIGGTTAAERNVISGNDRNGVLIALATATGNKVSGNYIGTAVNGTADLGNTGDGVYLDGAPNNTVGGTTAGERNIISGNNRIGVYVLNAAGNKVTGNYIGTNVNGTADLGNTFDGVYLDGAPNNTVGGATAGERNVISGNDRYGVVLFGAAASGNKVSGNFLGTDANGTADLGNTLEGVYIESAPNNIVGGTIAGERNILSGNDRNGLIVVGPAASGNKVIGNYIGTDVNGTADLGNTFDGVQSVGAPNNLFGGATVGERNVISGNDRYGVVLFVASATGNKVIGNYIGTDANGTADLGNTLDGVSVQSANNTVGGTTAAEFNLISGNNRNGVALLIAGTGNAILGNSIFNNSRLAIDLGNNGITANDALDADTGLNNLQNFPVLSCATSVGGSTTIRGTLNSLPTTAFRIEFFVNDACDASGNGEGQTFLGFQNVTTDASGNATINATYAQALAGGKFITATATRLDGANAPVETSEFSACLAVSAPTLTINDVTLSEGNAGAANFVFTVTLTSAQGSCLPVTVSYATANGTATAGSDYTTTNGTLTFTAPHASNSVTQTITVAVNGDTLVEPNETFFVNLSGATNATLTDAQGLGTITNDDSELAPLSVSLSDPLSCVGPGDVVNGSIQFTNPAAVPQAFTLTTSFTNLLGLPNTCVVTGAQADAICLMTAGGLTASGTAPANAVINVKFQGQIADALNGGSTVSSTSTVTIGGTTSSPAVASLTVNCPAAGPGTLASPQNQLSDQKAGSILAYPIYTSDAANAAAQNTRLAITNTHQSRTAFVHLFFVDGASCSVADSFICLTPNQTAAILASDVDAGTTGYVIAVATDNGGCPINFNYLIGDEYVKLATGHQANLGAEAIAALAGGLTACNAASANAAQINFDGVSYNALPRVLAASNLPSRADGNDTLLIVNRLGGNLATGAATLGTLFGLMYDDAEKVFSFSLPAASCQSRGSLSNDRPRLVPRYEQIIGAGRSGWLKLSGGNNDIGIFGAQINRNANAASNAGAFNQGHNLHTLTLTTTQSVTIPIFPPTC